eukprot:g11986.t1
MPYPPGQTTCPAKASAQGSAGMQQQHAAAPTGSSGGTSSGPPAPAAGASMPTAGPAATGQMGGQTISCSARPCGASTLGDVAIVTASGTDTRSGVSFAPGENIYGPFEAGFSSQQDFILTGLGCTNAASGYVAGGIDTYTAEQMVAYGCGITLPRVEGSNYISLLDECGGHTKEYHFHEKLGCLYSSSGGHSAEVGKEAQGLPDGLQQKLYGKFESTGVTPNLDACNGHFGVTPDSAGQVVYHYHVSDSAPFTIGCHGPDKNAAGEEILVTLARCRAVSSGCSATTTTSITRNKYPQTGSVTVDYKLWCPCYDGAGSNVGTATLPVFAAAAEVTKSSVVAALGTSGAATVTTTTTVAAVTTVNCVAAWSAWGNCTDSVESRTYVISTFPSGTGATMCAFHQNAVDQRPCGNTAAASGGGVSGGVNCTGTWADNGCTNGVNSKTYTRTNTTVESESCPLTGAVVTATCGTHCQGYWSQWGGCEDDALMCYYQLLTDASGAKSVEVKTFAQYAALAADTTTSATTAWKSFQKSATNAPTSCAALSVADVEAQIAAGNTGMVSAFVPGKMQRAFTAVQATANNGAPCPSSPETRTCNFYTQMVAAPTTAVTAAPLQPSQLATRATVAFAMPACKTQAELNADTAFKTATAEGFKTATNAQGCVIEQITCSTCPTTSTCSRRALLATGEDEEEAAETGASGAELRHLSATDRQLQVDVTLTFADASSANVASTAMEADTFKTSLKTEINTKINADTSLAAAYEVNSVTGVSPAIPGGTATAASSASGRFGNGMLMGWKSALLAGAVGVVATLFAAA